MKHIKSYNEDIFYWGDDKPKVIFNIEDHIDIEYINGCFSNLIDEADIDYDIDEEDNKRSYELIFYLDDIVKYRNGYMERIDQTIKHITEVKDLLEEIKSSIKKVQIEYPGLVPDLDIDQRAGIDLTDLSPINCIAVRYNENSVANYLKNKKK
jgi:hypothetical protein